MAVLPSLVTYLAIAVLLVATLMLLTGRLSPSLPGAAKGRPYESGVSEPIATQTRWPVRFALVGMLFLIFDVEALFFYPWAVVYRALGSVGLVEMCVFLGILMVGFVYAWDNGDARAIYRPHQEREVACGGLNQCSGFSTQYSR